MKKIKITYRKRSVPGFGRPKSLSGGEVIKEVNVIPCGDGWKRLEDKHGFSLPVFVKPDGTFSSDPTVKKAEFV